MISSRILLVCAVGLAAVLPSSASAQATWRLGPQPTLRLGLMDGDPSYLFNSVKSALRLPDGSIVVANDWELRFYSSDGRHLRTVGGQGQGPGEFGSLVGIKRSGNRLLAWDQRLVRTTEFDLTGNLLGTSTHEPPENREGFYRSGSQVLADGSVLWEVVRYRDPATLGMYRPERRFAVSQAAGGYRYLGEGTFGGLRQQLLRIGGRGVPYVQPFSTNVVYAVGADRLFVSDNEAFEIDVLGFDGRQPARLESARRRPAPVTQRELDAALESAKADCRARPELCPPELERGWAMIQKPRTHPMFSYMIVDALGLLWAQINRGYVEANDSPQSYVVLNGAGVEVANLDLPARFYPLDIGDDYVLGMLRGEFDVRYVVMYPLLKR